MRQEDESILKNGQSFDKPTFRPVSITECSWSTRDFEDYKYFLFPDADADYQPKNIQEVYVGGFKYFKQGIEQDTDKLPEVSDENIRSVFGGTDGFFHPNAVILDLGSGSGKATIEMVEKFSSQGVQVTGLDIAYTTDKPITHGHDIFVAGSWVDIPLTNNTFTGILSCESFPRHAWFDSTEEGHLKNVKTIKEITRVARPEAIWRATLTSMSDLPKQALIPMMLENGWEVYIVPSLMIARLQNKQDISTSK